MLKNRLLQYCFFGFSFIFIQPSQAKLFKNSYIQFQLPRKWACSLNHMVWVCRYKVSAPCKKSPRKSICKKQVKKSKEAVVVFTAKEAGEVDSLKSYFEVLKEARKVKKSSGQSSQSKVVHTKTVNIKGHKWVDGMHLGSEIPHYYTRYLATIKGNIAVLVTFSAHKLFYTGYSNQFFRAINSLDITTSRASGIRKNELGQKIFSRPFDIPDEIFNSENFQGDEDSRGGGDTFLFVLAVIMVLVGIYVWIKSKD